MNSEGTRRFRDAGLGLTHLVFIGFFALGTSCRGAQGASPSSEAVVTLVESVPVETTLDHAWVANAPDVWLSMIRSAKRSIDFAEFYASDVPEKEARTSTPSKLTPILEAIEQACARGVRVRFLADVLFAPKYPDTLERLKRAGAVVRTIDVSKTSGGILHAKYFVVDHEDVFIGSQNFDWRALDHIFEMGVRVGSIPFAGAVTDVFETDWEIAGGAATSSRVAKHDNVHELRATSGERISFVASPGGWLPWESSWDLPKLLAMIDHAKRTVDVQVLTYHTTDRDGRPFPLHDDALRKAAARGIRVRLLVSEWSSKPGSDARRAIEELARVQNVEVRVMAIPKWSGGDIPFARIAHAKYMVVDGALPEPRVWVGTSNWQGDYFTKSRNVGVVAEGGKLPADLERVFEDVWSGPYSTPLQ